MAQQTFRGRWRDAGRHFIRNGGLVRWTFFKKSTLTVCGSMGPENLFHNRIRSDRRTDVNSLSSYVFFVQMQWNFYCSNSHGLDINNRYDNIFPRNHTDKCTAAMTDIIVSNGRRMRWCNCLNTSSAGTMSCFITTAFYLFVLLYLFALVRWDTYRIH